MPKILDKFLPDFEKMEYHQTQINADTQQIYRCIINIDLQDSFIINLLFGLRGMNRLFANTKKPGTGIGLHSFTNNGFILLEEKPGHYVVLGLIGKFWTIAGALKKLPAADFRNFNQADFAKAVWSFEIFQMKNGSNILATETRIHCPDKRSRRRFAVYWKIIRPFSGLIRKEMLRLIKKSAEGTA